MSIREVAKRAGFSPSTVSRVLNDNGYPVKASTRQRVLQAARELNYFPNDLARGLLLKRTNTVGLIVPDLSNPYYPEITRGVEAVASDHGYAVIICNTDHQPQKASFAVGVLMQKRVDGIIIAGGATKYHMLEAEMANSGPKVVIVGRYRANFPSVRVDNRSGGQQITEHLIELGHRRIGFVSGPKMSTAVSDRLAGYRKALRDHGIQVDGHLVVPGDFTEASGSRGAEVLLSLEHPPTAIITATDRMAIGALASVRHRGLRTPDDVAIAGFDDITMASYTSPPLTTVSLPAVDMGSAAMRLLVQLIDDPDRGAGIVKLPIRLIIRESTAGPATPAQ